MLYSVSEVVKLYSQNYICARLTVRLFKDIYPDKSVNDSCVDMSVRKFVNTGSPCNVKHHQK